MREKKVEYDGNGYIINNEVFFNVNSNELQPLGENGEKVNLNIPTARCLCMLLEGNGDIISREDFMNAVWKTRGIIVSQNTFYQNISLLRRSLIKAGLSQNIIVTVRQRGFFIAAGANISSSFRQDDANTKNPLNVKVITNDSMQEYAKGNIIDKKTVVLKLPAWILVLLVTMIVVNVFFLLWYIVIG